MSPEYWQTTDRRNAVLVVWKEVGDAVRCQWLVSIQAPEKIPREMVALLIVIFQAQVSIRMIHPYEVLNLLTHVQPSAAFLLV